jgi:hypothetical protein
MLVTWLCADVVGCSSKTTQASDAGASDGAADTGPDTSDGTADSPSCEALGAKCDGTVPCCQGTCGITTDQSYATCQ